MHKKDYTFGICFVKLCMDIIPNVSNDFSQQKL